jgi:hypothetical protein
MCTYIYVLYIYIYNIINIELSVCKYHQQKKTWKQVLGLSSNILEITYNNILEVADNNP